MFFADVVVVFAFDVCGFDCFVLIRCLVEVVCCLCLVFVVYFGFAGVFVVGCLRCC